MVRAVPAPADNDRFGPVMKRHGCSIIFVNDDTQVLLVLRDDDPEIPYPNMWDIPGGHVEEGETPKVCIVREMKEEMGLDIKGFRLFSVFDFHDRIEHVFWIKTNLDEKGIVLTEGQRLKWFAREEANRTELACGFNKILADFFEKSPFSDTPSSESLENVCKEFLKAFQGTLSWQWDSRFDAALAEFSVGDKDAVLAILERHLGMAWDGSTIGNAPGIVQKIAGDLGGLRSGQLLFTSPADRAASMFGAWWPWGDGNTISIRVAPFDQESGWATAELLQLFKGWFEL